MKRVISIILMLFALMLIGSFFAYNYFMSPVDKNSDKEIEFIIEKGTSSSQISTNLEKEGLIKNKTFFKLYLKINKYNNIKAATYKLKKSMTVEEIVKTITSNKGYSGDDDTIVFKEGYNTRNYVSLIASTMSIKEKDIYTKLNDKEYLDQLIEKYWFLTDEIKNSKLFYSLEGYLFPDTYSINIKNDSIETIIERLLNRTDEILSKYKETIEKNNLNVHEILTMASIIEKEGKEKDFKNIASVFYNRINDGMKLQSCATAYYGLKKDFNEEGIATSEMISAENNYNTYYVNSLPVGPISMPGAKAVEAAINPNDTNYFYFLSDNQGNTYFFRYESEHSNKQQELIKEGKWYR